MIDSILKPYLHFTYRYLVHHRVRSLLLISALSITGFLPVTVQMLVSYYQDHLLRRATATPLVAGAKGSRYDLVLNTLYYRARQPSIQKFGSFRSLRNEPNQTAIPIYNEFTARGFPIVGTIPTYFDFRNLEVREGTRPLMVGDVVVGADVAEKLGKSAGDHLLSDQQNIYNIGGRYPLKMNVTGVLKESGTPDDRAIFTDLKTAWILKGIGHGHQDVRKGIDPSDLLNKKGKKFVLSQAVKRYRHITPDNLESFHFHGNKDDFPLTGTVIVPDSEKARVLLMGEYETHDKIMLLEPADVIREMLQLVFKVRQFFNANFAMVGLSTALFLFLVLLLSLRIRQSELDTLLKIGCSRSTIVLLQVTELTVVLGISTVLALILSAACSYYVISTGWILQI